MIVEKNIQSSVPITSNFEFINSENEKVFWPSDGNFSKYNHLTQTHFNSSYNLSAINGDTAKIYSIKALYYFFDVSNPKNIIFCPKESIMCIFNANLSYKDKLKRFFNKGSLDWRIDPTLVNSPFKTAIANLFLNNYFDTKISKRLCCAEI